VSEFLGFFPSDQLSKDVILHTLDMHFRNWLGL
jgi:hypothetical protein